MPPSPKIAVIGLDGATFRVLDPLMKAGAMPVLASLRERSLEATLRSTVPAYTPPAWVSMITGVNPGRHGIFGFLSSTPQEPPAIAHSGLIDAPLMWRYLDELGIRTGVFNVPMTYPPTPVEGFLVSGGIASAWTDPEQPNFAYPEEAGRLVMDVVGSHYPLDTVVSYENDWRSPAKVSAIKEIQQSRRRAIGALIESNQPDAVFAVFEGPDRIQHLFYQYIVECSDWYRRPEAAEVRDRILDYFAELDLVVSDLVEWAGRDGHIFVVSDHGFGPWEKTVNVNLLLAEWGFLKLPGLSRLTRLGPVAGVGQRIARRILPRRWLHVAKARVLKGILWDATRAFASHVAEQGIHVNEQGVFPTGVVPQSEAKGVEDELVERLMDLRDPDDGQLATDQVFRRDDVIHGPHAHRAPSLFPICRDQRYELSDTVAATSPFTDHRVRPWGSHHSDGIFLACGPDVATGKLASGLDIVDVLPSVFHAAGLPIPSDLDGRVITELFTGATATSPVRTFDVEHEPRRADDHPYTPGEQAAIEEALRGLGYIE
jgi:predicted AlkP superfamily phosphohydrolase/phosphomutase